jgi:hypothetical protein
VRLLREHFICGLIRKRPHKRGAAPKSGAAVAARLLRRNRPTEAVPARPSGRNRPVDLQEPLGRPAGERQRRGALVEAVPTFLPILRNAAMPGPLTHPRQTDTVGVRQICGLQGLSSISISLVPCGANIRC